jgi:ComF family protein
MQLLSTLNSCLNIIIPSICPGCGKTLCTSHIPVCDKCYAKIFGTPFLASHYSEFIQEILSCFPYSGLIKSCIKEYKYRKSIELEKLFISIIKRFLSSRPDNLAGIDHIVPVPISRSIIKKRSFDHAEHLAAIVSRLTNIPLSPGYLIKTRDTPHQASLSGKDRINNLEDSFSICNDGYFKNSGILLIDDVTTTGTTLNKCAIELHKSRALTVSAFTLARTL